MDLLRWPRPPPDTCSSHAAFLSYIHFHSNAEAGNNFARHRYRKIT